MLKPFDNTELDTFFKRLNAPLHRMPQQERTELHQEVRQHLDGLTAAYEELGLSPDEALESALRAFGDPCKIGRRMYWEWRRGQWRGLSGEMKAVLSMIGLYASSATILLTALVWSYAVPPLRGAMPESALLLTVLAGIPALAGGVLGRLFPKHAVVGAFYATVALTLMPLLFALAVAPFGGEALGGVWLWAGSWLSCACGAAYLSSRGRGEQGRFRLSDLRLRQRQ